MEGRAREWDAAFIRRQISAFAAAHPDYPELVETLEGELHRRRLNALMKEVRSLSVADLEAKLRQGRIDFRADRLSGDELEVIETWWRVKTGKVLRDDYRPEI